MPKHILIIDDEDLVLKSLSRLLQKAGYEVTATQHADQALTHVKQSVFDLIISDIKMPGKTGVELLKEIRSILAAQNQENVPEIFMTGYASEETAKEAEGMKVAEYVYKPFDVKQFLQLVEKHIKK